MATQQQQQQFVSTYGPYAVQAGSQLGVAPNVILGQWAFESAWGTSRAATQLGNVAGINVPGSTTGTNYASYSDPQQFEQAYVSLLQNPRYASALNTGGDVGAFTGGLAQGGYYTSSPTEYSAGVASTAAAAATINPALASGGGDTLTLSPQQASPYDYLNQDYFGGAAGPGGAQSGGTLFTDPATGAAPQGQPLTGPGSGQGAEGQSVLPALGIDLADLFTRAGLVLLALVLIAAAAWALSKGELGQQLRRAA